MCVAVPYRTHRDREYPCEGPKKHGSAIRVVSPDFPDFRFWQRSVR